MATSIRISASRLELPRAPRMSPMNAKRIVVADDLGPVLKTISELLQPSFDLVATASDGAAALELTLKLQPDLVVLDISMPVMSGIEVAEELTRLGSKTKIVFLTAHQDTDILKACQTAGGLGYVLKLAMVTDLIPAINAALAGRSFASRFSSQQ